MITCSEARRSLVELVFGELDSKREMRVNQHLLECAGCRDQEAGLLRIRDAERRNAFAAPPALRARIERALPAPPAASRLGLGRPVPAYVALAAALLVGLAGALLPLRIPVRRLTQPGAGRAAGVVLTGRETRFTVADSYDTRVHPTSAATE